LHVSAALLAAFAGVSVATCHRALRRLEERGYLERLDPVRGVVAVSLVDRPAAGRTAPPAAGSVADLAADAARSAGLGRAALRVWRELGCSPTSVTQLATSLGVTVQTVGAHLRALEAATWVRRESSGWVAVGAPSFPDPGRRARQLRKNLLARQTGPGFEAKWQRLLDQTTTDS
jgi:DNA-binding MarR family transcriptional regulator